MFLKTFCPVFHAVHFRFSALTIESSVFRNNTQQTFFLHSRHSQYTQSLFRISGLKIEFRFPNIKIWVQFSGLKKFDFSFQFSGSFFWARDLEIFHEKNQKTFKAQKMSKIVPYCPKVSWGDFFGKSFLGHCSMDSSKVLEKVKKNSKLQKCLKSFPKMSKLVLNMFCGNFSEKKLPRVPWRFGLSKFFKKKTKKNQNSKNAQNRSQKCPNVFWTWFMVIFPIFLPSNPCRAFQIFWT